MAIDVDPITPADPAGYYADLSDLYAVGGTANVKTYSDLDGTGTLDEARAQKALDRADSVVNAYLRRNGQTSPAATDDDDFDLLTEAASRLAVRWLYISRGNMDVPAEGDQQNGEYYAKLGGWKKEAYQFLRDFVMGKRRDISNSFLTA